MKHFGNCTMEEFLKQTVKFRAPFTEWLKAVGAADIYNRYKGKLSEDATNEEIAEAFNAFVGDIEAAALEKCPELTIEVLKLATFDDGEEHTFADYEKAAVEMYLNRDVRGFFVRTLKPSLTTSSTR